MARPRKEGHERRTHHLGVRLTAAEIAYVEEQAGNAGLTASDYVRTLALTEKVKPRRTKIQAEFLVELNKIGVNLNQIARARNAGRDDPNILQYAIDEIVTLMKKIDAAL